MYEFKKEKCPITDRNCIYKFNKGYLDFLNENYPNTPIEEINKPCLVKMNDGFTSLMIKTLVIQKPLVVI